MIAELRVEERVKWEQVHRLWPTYPTYAPEGEKRREVDALIGESNQIGGERIAYTLLMEMSTLEEAPDNAKLMDLVNLRRHLRRGVEKEGVEATPEMRRAYREMGDVMAENMDRLSVVALSRRPTPDEAALDL